jgi:hypothetical protein
MSTRLYFAVAVAAVTAGSGWALPQEEAPKADKEAQVRAAIEGYLENRNSFAFLRCRYTYTVASAPTLRDALNGTNYVDAAVSRRLLLVDGPRVLHVEDVDPEVVNKALKASVRKQGGRAIASVPFDTSGYLSDGPNKLDYSPRLRCANIVTPEAPHLGTAATILALGNPTPQFRDGPDYELELCKTGKVIFWPEGLREIEGRPAVCVLFGNAKKQRTGHYAFDIERGFLPLRIVTYEVAKNREYGAQYLTHARECSRGRWFPMRSVNVTYPPGRGRFLVRETKVVELDVDKRPRKADFTLRMEAGTAVLNPLDRKSLGFRLKQTEDVNVADLPRLLEMCKESGRSPLMDTGIHGDGWPAWQRWAGGMLVALALGLVAYGVRRRRARP